MAGMETQPFTAPTRRYRSAVVDRRRSPGWCRGPRPPPRRTWSAPPACRCTGGGRTRRPRGAWCHGARSISSGSANTAPSPSAAAHDSRTRSPRSQRNATDLDVVHDGAGGGRRRAEEAQGAPPWPPAGGTGARSALCGRHGARRASTTRWRATPSWYPRRRTPRRTTCSPPAPRSPARHRSRARATAGRGPRRVASTSADQAAKGLTQLGDLGRGRGASRAIRARRARGRGGARRTAPTPPPAGPPGRG